MTREDVISWLEYLSDDARSKADGLVPTNIEIACRMAIEALRAQEPLPVKYTTSTIRCPKCNEQITSRGAIHNEIKYCWKCGQAVKWE